MKIKSIKLLNPPVGAAFEELGFIKQIGAARINAFNCLNLIETSGLDLDYIVHLNTINSSISISKEEDQPIPSAIFGLNQNLCFNWINKLIINSDTKVRYSGIIPSDDLTPLHSFYEATVLVVLCNGEQFIASIFPEAVGSDEISFRITLKTDVNRKSERAKYEQ